MLVSIPEHPESAILPYKLSAGQRPAPHQVKPTAAELASACRRVRQIIDQYEGNFSVQIFATAVAETAYLQPPDEITGSNRPTYPFLAGNASMVKFRVPPRP
jgi:hypothetical protein